MESVKSLVNKISGIIGNNEGAVVIALALLFVALTIYGIVWIVRRNKEAKEGKRLAPSRAFFVIIYVFIWFFSFILVAASGDTYSRKMKRTNLTGGLNIDALTDTPY